MKQYTSEDILQMKKVPPVIAGQYLGMGQQSIRYALQQEKVPFGFAVLNPNNKKWTYYINPKKLVSYKEDVQDLNNH